MTQAAATETPEVPPKKRLRVRKEWEADELRTGLEEMMEKADRSADIDRDELCIPVADIQWLLDRVDARDSLAYLEAKRRPPKRQY
jgi:hypothetical protein